MKFCLDHWNRLRAAIDARGLSKLVHQGGAAVVEAQVRELQGTATDRDFDPLMSAHWAIATNAMKTVGKSALYLMADGPEDPIDAKMLQRARARGSTVPDGATWPRCPLCYANIAHELTCDLDPRCTLAMKNGFDWMIDRAADDSLATAREKKLVQGEQ